MRFLNLEINNFMAIGHVACSLDNKGLVLIQGENKDDSSQISNGAGKSSILDGLAFCLFGSTARDESGDAVVNNKAKKDCSVSVIVADGERRYKITRYRKHSKHKNGLALESESSDDWKDISGGTVKLTQEKIDKLIGCTHDVFCSAIYAGQEKMPDLPGSTDKFLKMLIEEAAGITRLQSAYDIARARCVEKRRDLIESEKNKEIKRNRYSNYRDDLSRLEHKHIEWHEAHKANLTNLMEGINEGKAEYKKQLALFEGKKLDLSLIEKEIESTNAKIKSLDSEKEREKELKAKYDELNRDLGIAENSLKHEQTAVANRKGELIRIEEKIGSECSECGKSYSESDMSIAKAATVSNLKRGASELKNLIANVKDCRERVLEAHSELSNYQASMSNASDLIEFRDVKNSDRNDILALKISADNIAKSLRDKAERYKTKRVEDNPYTALMKEKQNLMESAEAEIAIIDEEIREKTAVVKMAEEAIRVFSPAGVRAHILDTVTPFLNSRTSEYLSILSDGNISATWSTISTTAKGEMREKFCINVSSETGSKKFSGLSGGEKRKVRLATFLALQDLMASRATKPINLFIADEIDAAMDDAGLERLMAVLEAKASDKGTVLTVSHRSLSDWIRSTVTVVKEDGFATLHGEALSV